MHPTGTDLNAISKRGRALPVIRASVVLLFVIGITLAVGAALVAVATVPSSSSAKLDVHILRFSALSTACLAGVALCLAIGLQRNKYWAYDGVLCALILSGMVGIVVAAAFPGGLIERTAGGILALISFLALRLHLRPAVLATFPFESERIQTAPTVWIRLIAAYHFLTAGSMFLEALNPSPARLFGVPPHGLWLASYALVSGSVCLYIGFGLYAMHRRAYRAALAFALWSTAILAFSMVKPEPPLPIQSRVAFFGMGLVTGGLIFYQLLRSRREFS